jgi:proteasome accessory factor B
MDTLERLLKLTATLLAANQPISAEQIRERVPGYADDLIAFRRTFARDKDLLRSMRLPLRVEPVPGSDPQVDGYRIDRDEYAGSGIDFEPDELAALHLANNLVRLDGDAVPDHRLNAEPGIQPPGSIGDVPFSETVASLIGAASQRRCASFRYNDQDRTIEPWRVSFARGHWYLSGWDRERAADRLFRVDRIQNEVAVEGEALQPIGSLPDPFELRGWELGVDDPITAIVRIDADRSNSLPAELPETRVQDDGSLLATFQVRNIDAFRSFVLSFLDHAEIIEPLELRDDLVTWLEAQL